MLLGYLHLCRCGNSREGGPQHVCEAACRAPDEAAELTALMVQASLRCLQVKRGVRPCEVIR